MLSVFLTKPNTRFDTALDAESSLFSFCLVLIIERGHVGICVLLANAVFTRVCADVHDQAPRNKRFPDVDRRRKITVPRLAARRARAHSMNSVKVLRTLPTSGSPVAPFGANDRTHVHTVLAYGATLAGVELVDPGDVVPFLDGVAPELG